MAGNITSLHFAFSLSELPCAISSSVTSTQLTCALVFHRTQKGGTVWNILGTVSYRPLWKCWQGYDTVTIVVVIVATDINTIPWIGKDDDGDGNIIFWHGRHFISFVE